ncbi:DUF397 domain-containing protein [Streptomyces sp. NPDC087844]|uniref:DUF397 domain-containing protein n=1 Tax=Streptomyces sp. NPDC087844 TaxID=3365805 RepID=UPI0037FB32A0
MLGPRRPTHWWDQYRGQIPEGHLEVSEVEHFATHIRTAQTVHLPGLLQTADHARPIFELTVPKLSRLEVELRVAHRLGRQQVLTRNNAIPYVGIIHDTALRLEFGGRDAVRTQLEYLAEASERDNVTLLIDVIESKWQRSSFSGGGGNNCIEVATTTNQVALRESDSPADVLILSRGALRSLIRRVQSGPPTDNR